MRAWSIGIGTIEVSNGLVGGGSSSSTSIGLNTSYVQKRVNGICDVGEAIQSIRTDGTVTCETMPIYTLNTSAERLQQTLKSSCPSGSSIQSISPVGDVVCHTDEYAENTITKVTVSEGLIGGGENGNVSIGVNTSVR